MLYTFVLHVQRSPAGAPHFYTFRDEVPRNYLTPLFLVTTPYGSKCFECGIAAFAKSITRCLSAVSCAVNTRLAIASDTESTSMLCLRNSRRETSTTDVFISLLTLQVWVCWGRTTQNLGRNDRVWGGSTRGGSTTSLGDGGHVPSKIREKNIFADNYCVKFGHFSGKSHVRFLYCYFIGQIA